MTESSYTSSTNDVHEGFKVCSLCKQELPRTQFHKSNQTKDGVRYACYPCEQKRRRERYYENEARRKGKKRKRPSVRSHKLTSRVDKRLHEGVKYLAEAYGVTQSVIIERAIQAYVVQNMPNATRIMHRRQQ